MRGKRLLQGLLEQSILYLVMSRNIKGYAFIFVINKDEVTHVMGLMII